MSLQVKFITKEEWVRRVQRMSRKELISLCIEQHKERYRWMQEQTDLLRDLAAAKRKLALYQKLEDENRTRNQ